AHDFNNLLTVINGYSDLLIQTLGDVASAREMAQEIRRAGDRAASLTRQLLAFGRRQIVAPQVLNVNEMILAMEAMLRRLLGEDISLATSLDENLAPVKVDRGQLEQAIMNLAVNARDAMPTGGRLTIETRNVKLDDAYLSVHPYAQARSCVMIAVS